MPTYVYDIMFDSPNKGFSDEFATLRTEKFEMSTMES